MLLFGIKIIIKNIRKIIDEKYSLVINLKLNNVTCIKTKIRYKNR